MPERKPSFGERREQLRTAAEDLRRIAELIALEAIRMEAAEKRFSERRGFAKRKASR
jgi:hypothetical protein